MKRLREKLKGFWSTLAQVCFLILKKSLGKSRETLFQVLIMDIVDNDPCVMENGICENFEKKL